MYTLNYLDLNNNSFGFLIVIIYFYLGISSLYYLDRDYFGVFISIIFSNLEISNLFGVLKVV